MPSKRVEYEVNYDTYERFWDDCYITPARRGAELIGTLAGAGKACHHMCPGYVQDSTRVQVKYCGINNFYPGCSEEDNEAVMEGLRKINVPTGSLCVTRRLIENERVCATEMGRKRCHPSMKGAWAEWRQSEVCSHNCGDGFYIEYRYCLLPPCDGPAFRLKTPKMDLNQKPTF